MDKKKPIVLEYQELLNKQIKSLGDTIFCLSAIMPNGGSIHSDEVDADTIKTLVDTQLKLMRAVLSLEGVDIPLEYPEGMYEDDVKQVETAEERRDREEEKGFYA